MKIQQIVNFTIKSRLIHFVIHSNTLCLCKLATIKTKRIATITLLLSWTVLTAQTTNKTIFVGSIISDTTTFYDQFYWKSFPPILKSTHKIEIRFIISPFFQHRKTIQLTYDERWNAKLYSYNQVTDSLISKDVNKKISIDSLFSQLVINNIFSLQDQENVKTEKLEYIPETNEFIGSGMSVCDGICYSVEFKVGYFYRRYGYCDPLSYANFYPQVSDLRNFANIVEIFSECVEE